jgi:serine/threonine protein phosphatase PrpC
MCFKLVFNIHLFTLYLEFFFLLNNNIFSKNREIAEDSDLREFPVQKGDIILLSSDGLFDVLQDQMIEKIVNSHNENDLQAIADSLLLQTMRSYSLSQRDDILIMICRVEAKPSNTNNNSNS